MTLTDYKTAELFSRESSNWLFAKNALLVGTLSTVFSVLPYTYPVFKTSNYRYSYVTSASQTSLFKYGLPQQKPYMPKTQFGKKMLALREKAIAKGMPLLDQNEILSEIQKRRGLLD